jgi:hypothetical protein
MARIAYLKSLQASACHEQESNVLNVLSLLLIGVLIDDEVNKVVEID